MSRGGGVCHHAGGEGTVARGVRVCDESTPVNEFLTEFTYAGLVLVLLATGLGLPIPEDVPLLVAGYLCEEGVIDLRLTIPLAVAAIVGSDWMLFRIGQRYGERVTRSRLFRRFITPARFERASQMYQRHGGKVLFVARFLPGFRAALFVAAGAARVPTWKLLVFDGGAALLSAPLLILLGYWFSDQIDTIRAEERRLMLSVLALLAVVGVSVLLTWFIRRVTGRRRAAS